MLCGLNNYLDRNEHKNYTKVGGDENSYWYESSDGTSSICASAANSNVFGVMTKTQDTYMYENYSGYSRTAYDYSDREFQPYPLVMVSTDTENLHTEEYFLNSDYNDGNEIYEVHAKRGNNGYVDFQYYENYNNETGELESYYEIQEGGGHPDRELMFSKTDDGFTLTSKTLVNWASNSYDRQFNFDSDGKLISIVESFYSSKDALLYQNEYFDITDEQFSMPEYDGNTFNFLNELETAYENSELQLNYRVDYDIFGNGHRKTVSKPESHMNIFEKFIAGI